MQPTSYRESVSEQFLRLMKDTFSDYFAAYYDGDPQEIPLDNYPAMAIVKDRSQSAVGPTGMDKVISTYTIKVILNKASDYGAKETDDLTQKKIERLIEGRDATTGDYIDVSVLAVLRKNLSLELTAMNQDVEVSYDEFVRDEETISAEGHVTITVSQNITVNRFA